MLRDSSELLFIEEDIGALIRRYENDIRKEVDGWERNKILAASEHDLVTYLVEKYTLDAPRLLRGRMEIESQGEKRIDVSGDPDRIIHDRSRPFYIPGSYVTVSIPFEGDGNLFKFQASTYSYNPPLGRVSASTILISVEGIELKSEQVRQEIDQAINHIEKALEWTAKDCDGWNTRVQSVAAQCVRERKHRLLEHSDMVNALGIPLKRRPDAATFNAIPVVRKKRPIVIPLTPKETFKPEPALADSEYDYILEVIDRLSQSIERSPSTFANMREEQIRDMILVNLNTHYEGGVTGETFNGEGKTDILIREKERNAFIAECKFWSGPKALCRAIDQILGYLTWRDTKAALLIFSKNADFTNVLAGIAEAVPRHPNFKSKLRQASHTHVRYLFRQKHDTARDCYLAVQSFHIPKSS